MIGRRLITAIVGSAYAFLLILTYVQLSKVWAYIGFWYHPVSAGDTMLTIGAAGLLGLLLPVDNWTIVGFAKWILYFVLFIPALVIPPQQGVLPPDVLVQLCALIWVSTAIFIVILRDGKPFREIWVPRRLLWYGVFATWAVSNFVVYLIFRNTLNFVGLDDVYVQRGAASAVTTSWIAYVMGLMSGAINPFLLVNGMATRRPLFIAMGIAGQILVYSTLAGKVVLGATALTIGVFYAFRHGRVLFNRVYAVVLLFGALGPITSVPPVTLSGLAWTFSMLVYMRILVLPGVLVGVYSEFFLSHPITYLSHSLIGRPFTYYPYGDQSVGQVIGGYVTPSVNGGVNNYIAGFIAGDGIAGFGIWGVPIIFIFVGLWFWLLSKFVGKQDRTTTCAMLVAYVVSLANTSLFTSMLTGGGLAIALLLYLHRSAEYTEARAAAPAQPRWQPEQADQLIERRG